MSDFNYKKFNPPHRPGCYLYKDAKGKIIYVGKAKDLAKRVSQYFQKRDLDDKTAQLVNDIRDVEFITTSNEVEALLLEQSLIRQYDPKYNIDLKGNIRYAYIKVTDEKFPRILTARKIEKDGRYYGPYTEGGSRVNILKTIRQIFKIRTCTKLPKKVCLQYHLKNCPGPCENFITPEEYNANIKNAEHLLKGEIKEILADLRGRMKEASTKQRFEIAKMYRDQIQAIELIKEKQVIDQPKAYDQDVINWVVDGRRIYFQVFNVQKGLITTRHKFKLDNFDGVIEDFITQYYDVNFIPNEIILPQKLEDSGAIRQYLEQLKVKKFSLGYWPKVNLIIPQKGEKLKLLQLVRQNIEQEMGVDPALLNLKEILNLKTLPRVIEFFDISNFQGTDNVGAMIQLRDAKFDKSNYRKFKIKYKEGADDFASLYEVVLRRYFKEKLPDLVVIDGGRGQLNAALKAFHDLKISKVNVCSLAKAEEEIYLPHLEKPLDLDEKLAGMKLLIRGRDEVHRFVIKYHRLLRKKRNY